MLVLTQNKNYALGKASVKRCGWVCRQLRKAADFVADIPFIGGTLSNYIGGAADVMATVDTLIGTADAGRAPAGYEPTAQEASILDTWNDTRLAPFYKNLSTELSIALSKSDLASKIAGINSVINKICVVKQHFRTNETAGLSANAVAMRSDLISDLMDQLEFLIGNALTMANISKTPVTVDLNRGFAGYAPLITSSNAMLYKCENFTITGKDNIIPNPEYFPTTPILPISTGPTKDTVISDQPITAVPIPADNEYENTETDSGKLKSFFLDWWWVPVVIYGVNKIAGGGKKKK